MQTQIRYSATSDQGVHSYFSTKTFVVGTQKGRLTQSDKFLDYPTEMFKYSLL